MAGAFDFKIDSNGARIVVARLPLTPDCTDGDAIDAAVEALKHDLDVVAERPFSHGPRPEADSFGDFLPWRAAKRKALAALRISLNH